MRTLLEETDLVDLLQEIGLGHVVYQTVNTFSTGMKQRLKFAVLVASQAQVWILDEPTSNLDEEGKAFVRSIVDRAVSQGCTVLWATNELGEVRADATSIHIA